MTGHCILFYSLKISQVIAVCGGAEKCKFVLERGATHAIDHSKDNIRAKVKEFTGGQGVNVVMDQVGGDTLLECIKRSKVIWKK